ncbi:Glutathione transferase/Glutathione peroxidase/Peroxidase, partial [Scytalidium lignicola]
MAGARHLSFLLSHAKALAFLATTIIDVVHGCGAGKRNAECSADQNSVKIQLKSVDILRNGNDRNPQGIWVHYPSVSKAFQLAQLNPVTPGKLKANLLIFFISSYVILAAASTFLLNTVHSINTGKLRKAAKVPYPQTQAEPSRTDIEAMRFNCAQRAHMNYLEQQPSLLGALLIAGVKFPLISAGLGVFWSVSRYMYMVGYSTGAENGKGRYRGIYFYLAQLGLIGLAVYNGVTMILEK